MIFYGARPAMYSAIMGYMGTMRLPQIPLWWRYIIWGGSCDLGRQAAGQYHEG